jgi:Fungal specific transcription factor domain
LFRNEKDYRYFRLFCDKTARQLEGILTTNLWSRLIFQACEQNTAIRHGIVAIAALDITSRLTRSRCEPLGADCSVQANHYQFAIQQYSIALRHMQNETIKRELDLATALITSLIIICFESFHGNIDSAYNQITTGLRMIEEAVGKGNMHGPFDEGIAVSVLPNVDVELIRAFGRLDVQASSFVKNRRSSCRAFGKDFGLANVSGMPTRFQSMSEAKNYFEVIVLHYVQLNSLAIELASKDSGMVIPKSGSMEGVSMIDLHEISMLLGEARTHFLDLITRWHDAFELLLTHSRTAVGRSDFLAAAILELKYQALRFSIDSTPVSVMPDMIDYMPYFEKIVSLGSQILEHTEITDNERPFTFESELLIPLHVTALKCPHPKLRREAIGLLSSRPRREGLWDGRAAARLAEWIMNVEEVNLEDGYVPNEMRMTQITANFDMIEHTASVTGFVPTRGSNETIAVKAELKW